MRNQNQKMIHKPAVIVSLLIAAAIASPAISSPAQVAPLSPNAVTFTTLVSFDGSNGGNPGEAPGSSLVQGTDGNLYGVTANEGHGTFFQVTPSGSMTVLYNFCSGGGQCADGNNPVTPLLGTDGNFYGVTGNEGAHHGGTFYKMTSAGTLTTLYNFPYIASPNGLTLGANGRFYGTTYGGLNKSPGTVFEITTSGKLTTLYTFCSLPNCADGRFPKATVIQAADGNLYGTTSVGGAYVLWGTVFKLSPNGVLKTLHSFGSLPNTADGGGPSPLIQGADGNFYGTTTTGGAYSLPDSNIGAGTVFKITPAGVLKTIYNFCAKPNCTDGASPVAGLVQASDGNFYGSTTAGGSSVNWSGTIFRLTPGGSLTTLHKLDGTDGQSMQSGVLQATNGVLYGTPNKGGNDSPSCYEGCGTVFSLSAGLKPFVETVESSGKVGSFIQILGNGLTGATGVTFNGVAAAFTIQSDTLISATIPAGATTGFVKVTTSSGTLKSNVKFQVN